MDLLKGNRSDLGGPTSLRRKQAGLSTEVIYSKMEDSLLYVPCVERICLKGE